MGRAACIDLPDGRPLDFTIVPSVRTKTLGLKMTTRDGLIVSASQGMDDARIKALVAQKSGWILGKLQKIAEVRQSIDTSADTRPGNFDLAALSESWRVEYRQAGGGSISARTERLGVIVVYGAVSDVEMCRMVLRRWLSFKAKNAFGDRLASLAEETGIKFRKLIVRSQRTRWGSCSTAGVISLNRSLLFLSPECVRYIMIHELCHMLEPNHSPRFWALVDHYEPGYEVIRRNMRNDWKQIPDWANPFLPYDLC